MQSGQEAFCLTQLKIMPATSEVEPTQTMELIEEGLRKAGARRLGKWDMSATAYYSVVMRTDVLDLNFQRDFFLFKFSHIEEHYFQFFIKTNCIRRVTPDLLEFVRHTDTYRTLPGLSCSGVEWRWGDFAVRYGVVQRKQKKRSVLMEMQYLPLCTTRVSSTLFSELEAMIGELPAGRYYSHSSSSLPGYSYTINHLILQYVSAMEAEFKELAQSLPRDRQKVQQKGASGTTPSGYRGV